MGAIGKKDLFTDKNQARRRFPRREMRCKVGVLCRGQYFTANACEIGEGGMSFSSSDLVLQEGDRIVVTFQIPHRQYISLQAMVCNIQKKDSVGAVTHGVLFSEIPFAGKRQIRSYVSDRENSPQS